MSNPVTKSQLKHDIELRTVPINLFHMIVGKIPEAAIDEINDYIVSKLKKVKNIIMKPFLKGKYLNES